MGAGDFEYKGDKEKTNKSHDAEGYFTVGDVGYLNEDGYLFLCDRKSDMIIAGGVNIYPAEIEGVHPRAPAGRRRRGVRHPRRRHGRADQGGRRADARRRAPTTRCARRSWSTCASKLGKYKWPRTHRLHGRAAARAHRQAVEAQAARPVLGRPRPRDLTRRTTIRERRIDRRTLTDASSPHHVLEYPGGYTRSVGPVIGRFLTGLRDGTHRRRAPRRRPRARAADRVRPVDERAGRGRRRPLDRGRAARHRAGVHVGRRAARRASTRSTKPFAFALIRPDGADTAMLHVVDCGTRRRDPRRLARRAALARRAHRVHHRHRGVGAARRRRGARAGAAARAGRGRAAGHRHHRADPARVRAHRGRATDALPRRPRRGEDHRRPRAVESTTCTPASRGTDPKTGEPTSIEVEVAGHRCDHDVLRREHPRPVGARAGDPVRVGADPARRRRTTRSSA